MSENHALRLLRTRKLNCEQIIQSCGSEIARLSFDIDEQRRIIQQKTEQLNDVNAAIEKLEQS